MTMHWKSYLISMQMLIVLSIQDALGALFLESLVPWDFGYIVFVPKGHNPLIL